MAKKIVATFTNTTDPDTMTWTDLGMIWLFELKQRSPGGERIPKILFGPNALTTKDIMNEEGVQQAREHALQKIAEGNLQPLDPAKCNHTVCWAWQYGQADFYQGIRQRNTATSFLGSYQTYVDVTLNPDGSYTLHYTVENESGWESATRLRKADPSDPNRIHRGIIPNKKVGEGLHLGGTIQQVWTWTETVPGGEQ